MTAREAYFSVQSILKESGIAEPDAKARVIVSHALGTGVVMGDLLVTAAQQTAIETMAQRCAANVPVEYVTGKAYFRYAALVVTPDVLIPRHETELVAGEAISLIRDRGYTKALDMCTGSGCIAVALATETQAAVDACDISPAALAVATRNADTNNARIRFFQSDMFDHVKGQYDIIVCNPPYVSDAEFAALDDSVKMHEPKMALAAGDGLAFYRIMAHKAPAFLASGGALVLEIGASQAAEVTTMLTCAGFLDVTHQKDYAGRDRIVCARKG
jgi:release factor glutamine methyltransferase